MDLYALSRVLEALLHTRIRTMWRFFVNHRCRSASAMLWIICKCSCCFLWCILQQAIFPCVPLMEGSRSFYCKQEMDQHQRKHAQFETCVGLTWWLIASSLWPFGIFVHTHLSWVSPKHFYTNTTCIKHMGIIQGVSLSRYSKFEFGYWFLNKMCRFIKPRAMLPTLLKKVI